MKKILKKILTIMGMASVVVLVVAAVFVGFWAKNHEDGTHAPAQSVPSVIAKQTVTVAAEEPTKAPTETATAQVAMITEVPVTFEATNTPSATETSAAEATAEPTQAPTQTSTPEMALQGGWSLVNGDTGDPLKSNQAVVVIAFNGTDQQVKIYPDDQGKVDYSQKDNPTINKFGLIGVLPLNKAPFQITLMPFKQEGHKLILLDPTASTIKAKDRDTLLVSNSIESEGSSEVLRFSCKTESCAHMVLTVMGKVGHSTISCDTIKSFTTRSDSLYKATYRSKNGWTIGDTNVGPGVSLGSGENCQVGKYSYFVDRYGSLVWRSSNISPAPTSTPINSNSGSGAIESGNNSGISDQSGVQQPADQGNSSVVVIVPASGSGGAVDGGSSTNSSDQSSDCPGCNPVEVPPTPTTEAQVGVDLTPTPIH
jgi:hypothetical protein